MYRTTIPINRKKFKNLQEMCKQKDAVIPAEYHGFYESLPVEDSGEPNSSDDDISLQTMKEKLLQRKTNRNY